MPLAIYFSSQIPHIHTCKEILGLNMFKPWDSCDWVCLKIEKTWSNMRSKNEVCYLGKTYQLFSDSPKSMYIPVWSHPKLSWNPNDILMSRWFSHPIPPKKNISGWWFGTCILFCPFSWECHHPNWRFVHHFSEGWRTTTNQIFDYILYLLWYVCLISFTGD